jgi:adenosylhomocysteine nucleosidase
MSFSTPFMPADRPEAGIFVVVGMRAEARLLRRLRLPVATGGGTASGAEAAVRGAVAGGATALLSFGLAGGLDPALRPGDVVVPSAVLSGDAVFVADPALMAWLGGGTPHRLLGADQVVASAAEKRQLRQATGAAALDVESGAVARIAAGHGLPFAVLRAICDPAGRDLPPVALAALDRQGAIGIGRVLARLLAQPRQVPALLRLAADAAAARRALAQRLARMNTPLDWLPPGAPASPATAQPRDRSTVLP